MGTKSAVVRFTARGASGIWQCQRTDKPQVPAAISGTVVLPPAAVNSFVTAPNGAISGFTVAVADAADAPSQGVVWQLDFSDGVSVPPSRHDIKKVWKSVQGSFVEVALK